MAYLEKPKGYWHWFETATRMCFPMKQDFEGLGSALLTAIQALSKTFLMLFLRFILLVTYPASVPFIALAFTKQNKQIMLRRASQMSKERDGMPPDFTEEEVKQVLDGKKSYEQMLKEKEAKWNS